MPLTLVVTGLQVKAVGSWSCGAKAAKMSSEAQEMRNRRQAGHRCALSWPSDGVMTRCQCTGSSLSPEPIRMRQDDTTSGCAEVVNGRSR